jgi:hypothetical protein
VRAGDERALNRIFWNTAGAAFLLSYRAGKYYNYERDGEDDETIIKTYLSLFVENQEQKLQFYG